MSLTLRGRPIRFSLKWLKPPPTPPDGSMTLVEHLRELRYRLVVAVLALLIGTIVCWFFREALLSLLERPYSIGVAALKAKYPDEKAFQEAMNAYRKDNPIPRGNIHMVVDHIEHIIKVAGIDHVGIGSDFDGIDSTPEQLEDVSKYPLITQELLNRGYKPGQIRKVLGENFMRVFRDVEKAAVRK